MESTTVNTTATMFVKIKKNAYVFAGNNTGSGRLRSFLKANEGKFVEVETEHLFSNQYNTSEFRLYDSMVDEIVNDARVNKGKCKYCGTMLDRSDVCCLKHGECVNYGVEWFTPENTYFLKYPQGAKSIEHVKANNEIKVGTYTLEACPSLDYLRLRNNRKTFDFKYQDGLFYVSNGIGYQQQKRLSIPVSLDKKLIAAINTILQA